MYVDVSANLEIADAVEIFAHELAHVAVGEKAEPHGKEWEDAFNAIHNEFNRIGEEMFDDEGVGIPVTSGKEYVREEEKHDGLKQKEKTR